ncbi:diacylglycerol kinase 4-like [Castanea sativa]|uniref:diacylglycerol kinase 4-like n=1 Tax=Castanea sativa TaxID=21020 RepID=UPI003F650CB5
MKALPNSSLYGPYQALSSSNPLLQASFTGTAIRKGINERLVEAHADDGLLEIFGLKQGWHASFVMFELIFAKHIAQRVPFQSAMISGE